MSNGLLDLEGTELVHTGKAVPQQKEAFEEVAESAGNSLHEIYDQMMQMVYTIDVSGSMSDGLAEEDFVSDVPNYLWATSLLARFRDEIRTATKEVAAAKAAFKPATPGAPTAPPDAEFDVFDDEDGDLFDEFDASAYPNGDLLAFENATDADLKIAILKFQLDQRFNLRLHRLHNNGKATNVTKLQAVKDECAIFVSQRFAKYPNAEVSVIKFDDSPVTVSNKASEAVTLAAINALHTEGGTHIARAVRHSINLCKKTKNSIVHHIVLISDGMDGTGRDVEDMVPTMKANSIVFDFIYVSTPGDQGYGEDYSVAALRRACEATGGEFKEVSSRKAFKQQFQLAATRLCLPPGATV